MTGFEVPLERGKVREFARAAQSTNPAYEGPTATIPPTFLTIGRMSWQPPSESVIAAAGFNLGRVLHAEEEFIFTGEPPSVGVSLFASSEIGQVTERVGRRGGRLRFATVTTSFRDTAGELVAQQRSTFVETEVPPSGVSGG